MSVFTFSAKNQVIMICMSLGPESLLSKTKFEDW